VVEVIGDAAGSQSSVSGQAQRYPAYERGQPVGLFVPCYIDQFYPEIAEATARILSRLGIPVDFPSKQTCCGQPAFNSGYWDEARRVARQFARAFGGFSWIVCPSGSCAAMCRVFYPLLEPEGELAQVGRRVFELCEFLVEVVGVRDLGVRFAHRVTLHVGCHTRRELKAPDPPQILLQHVKGIDFRPLPDAEECCGFGGTFSVKMPGVSVAMGESKAQNVLTTGAKWLVTTDISCMMHLSGILRRRRGGEEIRVAHIAELLAGQLGDR
jgi:L-lactate dehydrogenase complex protein LldE